MASPAEIQAQITRLGDDVDALRTYLQSLSPSDYQAWVQSVERKSAVGGGALETIGMPLAGLAAAAPAVGGLLAGAAGAAGIRPFSPIRVAAVAAALGIGTSAAQSMMQGMSDEQIDGLIAAGTAPQQAGVEGLGGTPPGFLEQMIEAGWIQNPMNPNEMINPLTGDRMDLSRGLTGGAGATPRFSTTIIGGQVYRINDQTGIPEPTGVMVPPGIISTSVDRSGNLVGIRDDGTSQVIQQGFGFAGIDPEREFALGEAGVTGFYGGSPTLARDQLSEQQRAARTGEALTARGQTFSLAPQLGQLGINLGDFQRQVLSNPADFLARAFAQRGETSPQAPVTMADILGNLRSDMEGINRFLAEQAQFGQGLMPTGAPQTQPRQTPTSMDVFGGTANIARNPAYAGQAPQVSDLLQQPVGEPVAADGFNFTNWGSPTGALSALNQAQVQQVPDFVRQAAGIPAMENGGHGFNMVITGDSSDGKPNEELVIDLPGDAGMAVIPLDDIKNAPKKKKGGYNKVPKAQDGGMFNFGVQLPNIPSYTQADIEATARTNAPPAVRDVFAGGMPAPQRFSFALPSPGMLSSLTPAERQAANTFLAATENASMEDVEFAALQQFGPTRRSPQAARVF